MSQEESFQSRVWPWIVKCFGDKASTIIEETRGHNLRFLEEALELVQSLDLTKEEAHLVVDYVFSRPIDPPHVELGSVMVTLAAVAENAALDMDMCGEIDLAKIQEPGRVEEIRNRADAKPDFKHGVAQKPNGVITFDKIQVGDKRGIYDDHFKAEVLPIAVNVNNIVSWELETLVKRNYRGHNEKPLYRVVDDTYNAKYPDQVLSLSIVTFTNGTEAYVLHSVDEITKMVTEAKGV